ncbi:MAG TPA: hydroxymethylglutaryl-CoA lyase [Candidatus Sulfotelmatobacter sp.]|nr:hydroxymethylglutaryl-CoA lyase [Candidatus Sulfotelmatobacter sp.]
MAKIVLHEVGMRDGLQIERQSVPTEQKIRWIEALIGSGLDLIQLGSFVHPEKVPQMADTDRLFRHFTQPRRKTRPVVLSGLVLNEKGLERGMACGVEYFCMGVSASDTHSRKNTGMGTKEAIARIIPMAKRAKAAGHGVQVSVQSAFGCGLEGKVPAERVLDIVRAYLDAGLPTIQLSDTAGHAVPDQVEELYGALFALEPALECACHFHDTYGLAMADTLAALKAGVTHFEVAFGGLGGCPFTAVTGGNLTTEDFIYFLQRTGRRLDIDIGPIIAVASEASRVFQRTLPGTVHRIGPIKLPSSQGAGA